MFAENSWQQGSLLGVVSVIFLGQCKYTFPAQRFNFIMEFIF